MSTFNIQKILVPVDFSGTSEKVLNHVALMAQKTGAKVYLLYVKEGPLGKSGPDYFGLSINHPEKFDTEIEKWATNNLGAIEKQLQRKGVTAIECLTDNGAPYKKILDAAKKIKPDIIVMGTHGVSGFREFVVGSNTFRIVSETQCPVLSIQKSIKNPGFKRILIPFRDKPHSREKIDYALALAKLYGATIDILGISFDPAASAMKKIDLEAKQIKSIAEKQGVKANMEVIKSNYVSKRILDYAKEKKDDLIVVMSDLDRMSISEYVIGPVIQQIVNHSHIPVLSIHPTYNPNVKGSEPVDNTDWRFWY